MFLAPEGGQVVWTFSGCYHNDFSREFSVASLTLACGDTGRNFKNAGNTFPMQKHLLRLHESCERPQ